MITDASIISVARRADWLYKHKATSEESAYNDFVKAVEAYCKWQDRPAMVCTAKFERAIREHAFDTCSAPIEAVEELRGQWGSCRVLVIDDPLDWFDLTFYVMPIDLAEVLHDAVIHVENEVLR